jgi:hypothetical protein
MEHRYRLHDLPAARRTEARKAARKVAGAEMTAARFDQLVDHVSTIHGLPATDAVQVIRRVAVTIAGYGSAEDLLFYLERDQLTRAHHNTVSVVDDVAGQLGHENWLARMTRRPHGRT